MQLNSRLNIMYNLECIRKIEPFITIINYPFNLKEKRI